MPRYSVTGVIAAGIGGTRVSLNRRVIAEPAGGADWLDATRIIYNRKIGAPDRWALHASDGAHEELLDEHGATRIAAGGGVWAVERGGPGVRSNRHPVLPMAGLRDVGPDGTLGYCRAYHDGRGLILLALDGTTTIVVPETAACHDVQVHDARHATWVQRGRIRSTYGDPVTPDGTCGVPRVVTHLGRRMVLYFLRDALGECLVLQTDWTRPVGYVLSRAGGPDWPAFRPDLVSVAGELRACWSVTEAEGPPSIRERLIDLTRPVVDLRRVVSPPPPPPPPPPPETDVTHEQLRAYLAPQIDVIAGVKRDYPSLKGHEITDQVIHRLNKKHQTDRFGRKARQSNGGNPNDDVVTIRLKDDDRSQKKMIDILGNAHPSDPAAPEDVPTWGVIPASQEAGNGFWTPAIHPDRDGGAPPPPPPPVTHKYMGGGNDTGTCDQCGRSRFDAVHQTPKSKTPHPYDPGENGAGLCDECQQEPGAAIHGAAPPPPPPPPEDEALALLRSMDATLKAIATHVGATR